MKLSGVISHFGMRMKSIVKTFLLLTSLTLPSLAQSEVILDVDTQAQVVYVYDDDELLEVIPASTGRIGKETPLGEFTILQKREKHISSIYKSSMPYMQRLTWTGIAIHAGDITEPYASHGCIRVSYEDARKLFSMTKNGTKVYVR